MKSIRQHLVKVLSLTITGVVVLILLITDIAVDTWVDSQFDSALRTKMRLLMTLVVESDDGVELHFYNEVMPEFEETNAPEYFQIWTEDGKSFERSKSLVLSNIKDLPYEQVAIGAPKIRDIALPDGRSGRIIYSRFIPRPSNMDDLAFHLHTESHAKPVVIAYATSAEDVNFVFWLIDIVFVITTLSVVVFIRIFVRHSVDMGLSPLNKVNAQIRRLRLAQDDELIELDEPVEELIPIQESLNRFIEVNRQAYLREKRLTSDISHELKTPITELINLTEVIARFPDKNELKQDYPAEVLRISQRLRNIVENVLLLHKYEQVKLVRNDILDVNQLLQRLSEDLHSERIRIHEPSLSLPLRSNLFALESILMNLLRNAVSHSKEGSEILVSAQKYSADNAIPTRLQEASESLGSANEVTVIIRVSNIPAEPIQAEELAMFFDPLWQKDSSRTSNENFGLGLPIAKAFASSINATLNAKLEDGRVVLTLMV